MYEVNQMVMYGGTGVCKIIKIGQPEFSADEERLYYFLEPVYQDGMIYAPVDNEKLAIRPVISADEANEILQSIGEVRTEVYNGRSMQQLSQHYQKIIDSHSCKALMKLTKLIYAKRCEAVKNNKRLGQIDKRFMKKAEELLYGEISAALDVDMDKVAEYVRGKLDEEILLVEE